MFVEKDPDAVIEPHALPHPVTEHEAAVIDRDFRLVSVDKRAIDPNQDVIVAGVILRIVRCFAFVSHGVGATLA